MNWPTSQDYNEAVQNPATSFGDLVLQSGQVILNSLGLPVPRSGNFADVYQFKSGDGKMWAVKCFTRKVDGLQQRYLKIDEHLTKARLPFTVGFKFFAEGIRVRGQWYPLLKMEWVEGFTLNEFVRNNADKPNYLHALTEMWGKLTAQLRDANSAHADLQHGNVLLVPATTGSKLGLRLIDYDGMWVPALADKHSGEIGHPNFQHPLRLKDRLYNADVDRFPHLVVACALRATLCGGKALWDRFDNGDNLLFKESDLADLANAPVFKVLWNLKDNVLCTLLGKLALAATEPLGMTPWLDDLLLTVGGMRLTAADEKKVIDLLGVTPHFTASERAAAQAATQVEFGDFNFSDDPTDEKPDLHPQSARTTQMPTTTKKSPLPYYIGGGVIVAAFVIGGVIAMNSGGKGSEPSQPEVAKNNEPDLPISPPSRKVVTVSPKALPAEAQVKSVIARLKERNPGFDGAVEHRIEGGAVTELKFITDNVTDISPVQDLKKLERLFCTGSAIGKGKLADLTPLTGMKLTVFRCFGNPVADLTPLKGMPLTSLDSAQTQISDLTPLKDMPLTFLQLWGCRLNGDLSPLKGMPLTFLDLNGCNQVRDLAPLQGMKLGNVTLNTCQVQDLTPLRGMPLTVLSLWGCGKVSDLSSLKDLPLKSLNLAHCGQVPNLSHLQGMKLTWLSLADCGQVRDLTPLQGMKLTWLDFGSCPLVQDLTPLQGMPLTWLGLDNCPMLHDLTSLQGMPLEYVRFTPKNITKGIEIVRRMNHLKKIGVSWVEKDQFQVDEFWKKYDAGAFGVAVLPNDPIRAKLEQSKTTYLAEMEKCRASATAYFDKRLEDATKAGRTKDVDQIKEERKEIDDTSGLPKKAPLVFRQKADICRVAMEAAFELAVKEYAKANNDDQVTAVGRQYDEFKKNNRVVPAVPPAK